MPYIIMSQNSIYGTQTDSDYVIHYQYHFEIIITKLDSYIYSRVQISVNSHTCIGV